MKNDPLPPAVSDAGPLIHLAQISKLLLLKKLFKRVSITPEVKREVVDEGVRLGHADALVIGKALDEGWIVIRDIPRASALIAKRLAKGENLSLADAKTLLSAKEKGTEIVVDEKALSDLAKMYGLKVWNTWTILLEALRRGFIEITDIESAIIELGEKRHKLKNRQVAEIIEAAKLIDSRSKGRRAS